MANLFVVHTPLCFFVAQNIILQERTKDNILLIRNVEDSSGFSEAYKLLKIDELWSAEYTLTDSRKWKAKTFRTASIYIRNERELMGIIKKHNVTEIFLDDINDLRFRLAYMRFYHRGISINIYEEGLSHYARMSYISNRKMLFGSMIMDFFVLFPSVCLKYLRYLKLSDKDLLETIIKRRFNILPRVESLSFDVPLKVSRRLSPQAEKKVNEVRDTLLRRNGRLDNLVLYVSEPLLSVSFASGSVVKDTIKSVFEKDKAYLSDKLLVVKFHPRESEEDQQVILDIIKSQNINYCVLETHKSIPIEVYLQNIPFLKSITFTSSACFYSGYVYDSIPCEMFVSDYRDRLLKAEGLEGRNWFLLNVERSIQFIEEMKKLDNCSIV